MSWIVESRCAMAIVVRPAMSTFSASRISSSVSVSTLDVASSRIEDPRVERERPREGQQLLLPDREGRAALAHRAVQALRQAIDEPVGVHGLRGAPDRPRPRGAVPSRMLPAIVPENSWTSCSTRLKRRRSSLERHLADVDAVDAECARASDVVEPHQQVDERGLARAGRADHADPLAGLDVERHVAQHVLLAVVGEPDVVELDAAA